MIRSVREADIPQIIRIYNYYVKHTIITFEEDEIEASEMGNRVKEISQKYPWFVYEEGGKVIGYAYANLWRLRSAYQFSAEATVYLDVDQTGKGIGSELYEALISALKNMEIHSLIGGISLPNQASVALHEKFGFVKCAQFREVGRKFDSWIDVGYWEKLM
jgi:phosphinothricin acetyltransferase